MAIGRRKVVLRRGQGKHRLPTHVGGVWLDIVAKLPIAALRTVLTGILVMAEAVARANRGRHHRGKLSAAYCCVPGRMCRVIELLLIRVRIQWRSAGRR